MAFFPVLDDITGNFLANNFNKAERPENSATAAKFAEAGRGKPINLALVLSHMLSPSEKTFYFRAIAWTDTLRWYRNIFRPIRKQFSRYELACSSKLRTIDAGHPYSTNECSFICRRRVVRVFRTFVFFLFSSALQLDVFTMFRGLFSLQFINRSRTLMSIHTKKN